MKLRKVLSAVAAAAVATTAFAVAASAADYNGYISFQTTQFSFRNTWNDGSYGKATPYFNSYIAWGNNDPETWPQYEDNFDYDITGYVLPATYIDATITGDGTYTVEAKDLDWALTGDSAFNLMTVNTDIPVGTATITKAKIIVDGVVTSEVDAPLVNPDDKEYVSVLLANIWNNEIGDKAYTGAFPTQSLAIEFTVEGLGAADTAVEDTAAAGDVDGATDSTKGSPDTGVADVAVVAGLAVLAGGAFIVAKKRK